MNKEVLYTETKRLIIRNFKDEDLVDYHAYISDPFVVKYEPYKPQTLEQMKNNIQEDIASNDMVAVELKANHKMIGNIFLGDFQEQSKTLGYVFNKDYWKKGYAKKACQAVITLAFAHGIKRIEAKCDPLNIPSWKLLESLDFKRIEHLKQNVYFWKDELGNPIWKDTFVYSLHK